MADRKPVDLPFPIKGLVEMASYTNQPEGTTPECLNVRPFDTLGGRLRGGPRAGLSKVFADAVNGTKPIQRMGLVTQASDAGVLDNPPIGPTTATDTFTEANGALSAGRWQGLMSDQLFPSTPGLTAAQPIVSSNKVAVNQTTLGAVLGSAGAIAPVAPDPNYITPGGGGGEAYTYSMMVTMGVKDDVFEGAQCGLLVDTSLNGTYQMNNGIGPFWLGVLMMADGGGVYTLFIALGGVFDKPPVAMTPGSNDYLDPAWWATPRELKVVKGIADGVFPQSDVFTLSVDGTVLKTGRFDKSSAGGDRNVGFYGGIQTPSASNSTFVTFDTWTITYTGTNLVLPATFTQDDGPLAATEWTTMLADSYAGASFSPSSLYPKVVSNVLTLDNAVVAGEALVGALHNSIVAGAPVDYEMTADVSLVVGTTNGAIAEVGFINDALPPPWTFPLARGSDWSSVRIKLSWFTGPIFTLQVDAGDGYDTIANPMTPGSNDYKDPAWWATPRTMRYVHTGSDGTGSVYIDGTLLLTQTPTSPDDVGNIAVGVTLAKKTANASNAVTIDNWTLQVRGPAPASNRRQNVVVVSGGNIYEGTLLDGLALATGGTSAVAASGRVALQDAFGNVYFCDGTSAGYKVLTIETATVTTWTPSAGSLPLDSTNAAKIIALYRGRVVLSGILSDPQNWFMSAVGDPLNWNYIPNPFVETQAIAGNNTFVIGKVGDIITCLAPVTDDLMIMGGDHTLWRMTGDPAAGGRIDNISQQVGVAGPDAFCFDPSGIFYFMGNSIFWRMSPGGVPEPISRGRLDRTLAAIDLSLFNFFLTWDDDRQGVYIFVVPHAFSGASTSYFWDARTDSFWPDQFPDVAGPTCVLLYDGDLPTDRAVWLGGQDSYIRKLNPLVKTDDGTAITSRIRFGPIQSGSVYANTRLVRVTAKMDTNSDPVNLRIYAGNTPQEALTSSAPVWARAMSPVYAYATPRINGNALAVELGNTTADKTWAVESLSVLMEAGGRTRHGRL